MDRLPDIKDKLVMSKYHDEEVKNDSQTTILEIEKSTTIYNKAKTSLFCTLQDVIDNNIYISQPFTLDYFWTQRGSENFHIYLWIAKDLAWTQSWYYPAMIFGSCALAWCFVLLYHAIQARNWEECYMWVSLTMWLAGNFVWMAGEVFNGDDDYVVPKTAVIMESAIAWILFFHIFLRPFGVFQNFNYDNSIYDRGLTPRFSYFKNWRQYENAHTLCWLGKDLSWNRLEPISWIFCLIPTVSIAADFIYVTFRTGCMMEDTVHYLSQLTWVIGNMLWAMGNIFPSIDDDDYAYDILAISPTSKAHMRWWASWTLFAAYWPIILLYMVWLPLTFMNKFPPEDVRKSLTAARKSVSSRGGSMSGATTVAVVKSIHHQNNTHIQSIQHDYSSNNNSFVHNHDAEVGGGGGGKANNDHNTTSINPIYG